jgi:hypothetical protein
MCWQQIGCMYHLSNRQGNRDLTIRKMETNSEQDLIYTAWIAVEPRCMLSRER